MLFFRNEKKCRQTVENLLNELNKDSSLNWYSVMISDLGMKSKYYYSCFNHVMSDSKRSAAQIKKYSFGEDHCLHIDIL